MPGPIGRIRVLHRPFAALPMLQMVLEPAGIAPDWVVTPIDARAAVGVVCTFLTPRLATGFAHAYAAGQACPALPESFHRLVARGQWILRRTDGACARPFVAPVLDDDATLVVDTRCFGGHSSSLSSPPGTIGHSSYSSTSTSSVTDELGRIVPFHTLYREDEHATEMHVVFYAEGMRPWRHSFARTATSPDLARHAAVRMQGATGQNAWRIAFLPRQPAVRDAHLHVMVLPVGDLGDTLPFLLDSRRVFGGKLCNIQLLRTRPGQHNDPHGFANAAEQALLHAGLAEVSFAFHVSAHRPAAVVVPAWEGLPACVLEDSVHIILQFPGLRQAILRDAQSAPRPHAGTGTSTTATTTTTTTTTTFMMPDEPFRFIPQSPRRTIARLGIPTGTATGTFVEVTLAESVELPALLHRLTQKAAQQQCLPPGHSIAVSPCQPEARASNREILFHLVPPQVDKEHCYVWVDLRPSAELSYLRSATLAEPNSVSIRRLNVRSLYLNAHRWDEPRALRHGDLVSIAIAPQAPDIRPPDQQHQLGPCRRRRA